jgi:hypothetical protein
MRRRFASASRGDGTWPDLAPSTKAARMRGRKTTRRILDRENTRLQNAFRSAPVEARGTLPATRAQRLAAITGGFKFSILRDTNTLFNSLTTGAPGNITEHKPDGIRVGTNVKYARHHQKPKVPGRPPVRKILVPPRDEARLRIKRVLAAAAKKTLEQAK